VDLLVSLAIARQLGSAVLLSNLESVRHKLTATLSRDLSRRVRGLARRILVGQTASPLTMGTSGRTEPSVVKRLNQAFVHQNVLAIRYEDAAGSRSDRHIEPHYLLLNYPVWYVLPWDRLRQARRTFRCDRIRRAVVLDEPFTLQPAAAFQVSLLGADIVFP
jgi:predicted DNA-binding transcriptional regulator YafY